MHRLRRWGEAGNAALAAGLSALFGFMVIQPWDGDFDVPYLNVADANLYRSEVKGILEHGWYWHNPNLGAPEGQQLFDFPGLSGDPLNVLLWKLIGLFSSDAAVVVNVFFLLTFPLVGLVAYLVFRRLTLSVPVAIVCSILYTTLPYHFFRGELHLLLSAYYAVPIGAYLVLAILGDRSLFAGRRLTLGTLGLCAVVAFASGGYYYAAFTCVLVAAAAAIRVGVTRSWKPLAQGGAVVGAILALSLVTLAPSLVYWAKHGRNDEVAHRLPAESELFGLKFAQLVLPIQEHRIECARGSEAELRRLVSDDRGGLQHAARPGRDNWFPRAARGVVAAACVAREASCPAFARSRGDRRARGASLRLDRRACDAGRGGLATDSIVESALDLHRVLRAACGGALARSRAGRDAPRAGSGAARAECWQSASSTRRARRTSRRMRRSRPSTEATASSCRRSRSGCRRARWSSSSRTTRSRRRPGRSGWPTTT